jgi:integrase
MSSLWKHPKSKYWMGCFTAADGRQLKRSTRETDKCKARIIVEAWEQAESLGSRGLLTSHEQLRTVLNQTFFRLTGKAPETVTAQEWLTRWLKGEQGAVAEATFYKYRSIIQGFLNFLGSRAHVALEAITTEDFIRYRDFLLSGGRAPRTVNVTIRKILKRPFQAAVNEGFLGRNPVAAIRQLRDAPVQKGTFTAEQIRVLLEAAQGDWKGLILAGYYTGARVLDLARLRWGNVDLDERSINFVQRKTDARLKVPIHAELEDYLLSRSVPDDSSAPLFPELYSLRGPGESGLSGSFRRLMGRAGIDPGIVRQKSGKAGRSVSRLSFHSLRHSFVTNLANAGVPAELRMKLAGHASAKSHATYSHLEFEAIRQALEKLERLPEGSRE